MQLSTKPRYALRILLQLADSAIREDKAVKARDISVSQNVTEAYIEQIMLPLKRRGYVKTVRGCNGGYMLAKSPRDITVLDVIEVFEGEINLVNCHDKMYTCQMHDLCITREVWQALTEAFKEQASSYSLYTIIKDSESEAKECQR
jgi:Rrf2 family protein